MANEDPNPLAFKTIAANWENFFIHDIPHDAPPVQVHAMRAAFVAGLASGLALALYASRENDPKLANLELVAELQAFVALDKAARSG